MITISQPLQVVIFENDSLARLGIEQLLGRDLRTEVMAAFDRPDQLIKWVTGCSSRHMPHMFVIDAEYEDQPPLAELVAFLVEFAPGSSILLLSQYGGSDAVHLAAHANVAGLVLKKEIGLAVATAVYLAHTSTPIYSSALDGLLESMSMDPVVREWRQHGRQLPRWRMLRGLSQRQEEVAWHCLIFGMSAQLVGEEIELAKSSVEKYCSHLYGKIEDLALGRLDLDPLQPVMHRLYRSRPDQVPDSKYMAIYTGDDWAFHMLTQLPSPAEARRNALDKRHRSAKVP